MLTHQRRYWGRTSRPRRSSISSPLGWKPFWSKRVFNNYAKPGEGTVLSEAEAKKDLFLEILIHCSAWYGLSLIMFIIFSRLKSVFSVQFLLRPSVSSTPLTSPPTWCWTRRPSSPASPSSSWCSGPCLMLTRTRQSSLMKRWDYAQLILRMNL